ncbi:MAG TPA: protein kinase [Bryobacteraceae bacterium]|nr:protein kinase [Bryobacteraceae bacterium]
MSLSPASRLGPYEILARLGAGGMGEVYRARDTRLGREVAIKVLPPEVTDDAVRRARFEQEARAVAVLNHPNILALYDIGNENNISYMVTELVSGETLAALIEAGPVPVKKLIDIAVQIADGVAAAHSARITHRDLKPLNIMVSADGRVKILDFGLAKQAAPDAADPDQTMTAPHTQPGMILGTIHYMSPEQARGKATDYRSDQFSFGLILYEMAAGRKAFDKPESVQTMSAILTEEPPPIERPIPGPLRWAIDRCLSKDPADRYESSRDLFRELRSLRDHLSESSVSQAPAIAAPPPRRRLLWRAPAAFLLGILATLAVIFFRAGPQTPDQSTYRFIPFSFEPGGQSSALWSPDGKSVAYTARPSDPAALGQYQVYIRYLDSPTPIQITHTDGGAAPRAWTPDGKRLILDLFGKPGFWSISVVGGEPDVLVATVPASRVNAFSPDAQAVAYLYPGDDERYGVWISSPLGAKPQRYLPDPFATKDVYNIPKLKFSPDGKQLLLILNAGRAGEEVWLLPYPPNPSHPPRRVLPDLVSYSGTPTFCWMPDNRHILLAFTATSDTAEQIWLADLVSGKRFALTSGTTPRNAPSVSPDGRQIIFTESTGNFDIVSVDLPTAASHPLVATERDEMMPAWAARQPVLVYVTNRNGAQEIWLRAANGADRPVVTARNFLGENTQWLMGPALSPLADRVVYTKIDVGGGGNHLWISSVAGGAPVPLTNDATSAEYPGSWSLDGSWFTYVMIRDGRLNLMKVKTGGQAAPVLVKAGLVYDNNAVPAFSPDGQWIVLGESLFSADGQTVRPLGDHHSEGYVFSPDGKAVYGIRDERGHVPLFSVDVATGAEKIIGDVGRNSVPASSLNPAIRLSLAPDGKSLAYSTITEKDNLWLLEGFAAKTGLFARLGL